MVINSHIETLIIISMLNMALFCRTAVCPSIGLSLIFVNLINFILSLSSYFLSFIKLLPISMTPILVVTPRSRVHLLGFENFHTSINLKLFA